MDLQKIYKKINGREPTLLGMEQYSRYAVLLPLIEKNKEPHILFEVRSYELRRQPGEICFPGGKIDNDDKNEQHTAVRETNEELGIAQNLITNISPLDYLVNPFGTIIYPFVGTITDPSKINPNPAEVAETFLVPLSFFQKVEPEIYQIHFEMQPEEKFPFHHIIGGENYNWQTRKMEEHFYFYEDKVIWGMTARILHHFIGILK